MKLAAILAVAAADAVAEERRIVVSIPDRKLVLLDGNRVLKVYDVAVGKPSTPSPAGEFRVMNRIPNPTWLRAGKSCRTGKAKSAGHPVDRPQREGLRHSRHQRSEFHRQGRLARLHSHAPARSGRAVRPGPGRRPGGARRRAAASARHDFRGCTRRLKTKDIVEKGTDHSVPD